jgi:hypothetical protein
LFVILFWVVVTPILLELAVRAATPLLPLNLQIAAERVYKGESLDINRLNLMTTDGEHNFMMRPNVDNELYGSNKSVVFHITTVQILNSRMGFRTRPVEEGEHIDVAVVGDSFSFCFTEFEDCWVTKFEEQTGLRTMDLAQGSTGSVSHWRFVDTFGRAFQPPLVIWQFFVNDFNEDYQLAVQRGEIDPFYVGPQVPEYEDNSPGIIRWLRQHSAAFVVMETAFVGEDAYISDFERFHFTPAYDVQYNGHDLKFGQMYEQIATNLNDPRISSGVPMTRDALEQAQETVDSWGGDMVVFLVPTREEVYRYLTAPLMGEDAVDKLGDPRRVMLDLCDDLNLTCLDLLPLLQDYALEGDDLYYAEDMHLNPRGNQVVADIIQNWLIELNLIDEQ